jgi:Putative peptidoglycan binding domain/N-acetylmuramoyl-L-alanine amidase
MANLKVVGWGPFPIPGERSRLRKLERRVDEIFAASSNSPRDPTGGQPLLAAKEVEAAPLMPEDDPEGTGLVSGDSEHLGHRKIFFEEQEGPDVAQLQRRLASFGFLPGAFISGKFDKETKNALTAFQHKFGIYVDGVAGSVTANVLRFLGAIDYRPDDMPVSGDILALIQRVARSQSLGITLIGKSFVAHRPDSAHAGARPEIVDTVSRDLVEMLNSHPVLQGAEFPEKYNPSRAFLLANSIDAELVVYLDVLDSAEAGPGVATYFFRIGSSDSAIGAPLAECVHDELIRVANVRDRGCHGEDSFLLQRPKAPTVRIELGNLADPGDRSRLEDPEHLRKLARAIMLGISRLYDLDLPGPAVMTPGLFLRR